MTAETEGTSNLTFDLPGFEKPSVNMPVSPDVRHP